MVNQKLNYFRWKPEQSDSPPPPPTLVFLHGMGGTGQIWRSIAAFLEGEWDCIAPDQRGHGGSRQTHLNSLTDFHAETYAKDVLHLLDSLLVGRFLLIGHSMGVRTALALARKAPSRIAGIIAVDIGISSSWGGGMGAPLAEFIRNLPESFADRTLMKTYLNAHCPDPSIGQYLSAVATRSTDSTGTWSFPFDHKALIQTIEQAKDAPLETWVLEIVAAGVPIHFLRGMNSKVWQKEDYEEQKTRIQHPLLHFEEWENCGHGLPFEQRVKFIEFVRNLAEKLLLERQTLNPRT
ncbi:MAG: alpha/beta hydrolase [Bdellovibrionales bacterium]|nr:alpha/beta hydrolase [Bdellovibrionales bacterium]